MKLVSNVYAYLCLCFFTLPAFADDLSSVPDKKKTKAGLYVTSSEAAELLRDDNVILLDVRSRPEVTFVGLATRVDVHIPLMVMPKNVRYDPGKKGYQLEPNLAFEFDFLDYAEAHGIEDETPIVVMCRSGSRSAKAVNLLYDLGYTNAYSLVDGFEGDKAKAGDMAGQRVVNGWKNAGLAWGYAIEPSQVYPADLN
ncbi:rhodanese-like domain-containing protein [Primorskyibacter aestuariivivens]|uniref:rhodanese-like domain-containing protein n=1 Tax=Primorskyibacter aestuariivivens TaxID=1888912 RepID=UPI0023019AA1|nr:rhodanese-like domain-containing protein [Primorskyibacter aestuariivivens]MDA7427073.1 rhodanese-like domain-containing protein [Primorskyibacter aestuariivivens]